MGPSGPIPYASGPIAQPRPGQPGPPNPPSWNPPSGPVAAPPNQPAPFYQGGGWGGGSATPPPHGQPPAPTPWNQGAPPPRKRNPWPIVAAVAVVIVLIVGGVAIFKFLPDDKPKPPPKPIGEDRLSSLLLSTLEVNSVMGSSSMTPGKTLASMDNSSLQFSQADCQGALYNRQAAVYAGTGFTAVNALVSSEPGDNYDHFVNQAVVAFPTANKARSFLDTLAPKWKNCEGKTISVTNTSKNKTYRWTFGQVEGAPPKMDILETQEGADGWECQHSMRAENNIVVDVNACGYRITNHGAQIADKITEKVEKEQE